MRVTETRHVDLLKGPKQILISIYQRRYSWTRKECEQLWKDLLRSARNDKTHARFMGSFVYIARGLYQIPRVVPSARSPASALRSLSTRRAEAAPRERLSSPRLPVPANRSSTRAPSTRLPSDENKASRTRSSIGRVPRPLGAFRILPRCSPAMMRTTLWYHGTGRARQRGPGGVARGAVSRGRAASPRQRRPRRHAATGAASGLAEVVAHDRAQAVEALAVFEPLTGREPRNRPANLSITHNSRPRVRGRARYP